MQQQEFLPDISDIVQSDDLINWLLFNMDNELPLLGNEAVSSPSFSSEMQSSKSGQCGADELAPVRTAGQLTSHDSMASLEEGAVGGKRKLRNKAVSGVPAQKNSLETAKENRRKRRQRYLEMEERLEALKTENAELNAHMLNITQRTTEAQKQRVDMERIMRSHLTNAADSSTSQSELATLIKQYKEVYADYGKFRQREVEYHLQQIQRLLRPSKTTKMYLWTLQQEKGTTDSRPSSLFNILSKELELSEDQTRQIQEHKLVLILLLIFCLL